jgi:hypothetical protein
MVPKVVDNTNITTDLLRQRLLWKSPVTLDPFQAYFDSLSTDNIDVESNIEVDHIQ